MTVLSISLVLASLVSPPENASLADASPCSTDSAAEAVTKFARVIMTSADSASKFTRASYKLPRLSANQITVVADSTTCKAAALAAKRPYEEGGPDIIPTKVAIVRAGKYFFFEAVAPPSDMGWEILVFTDQWKHVATFGGGS